MCHVGRHFGGGVRELFEHHLFYGLQVYFIKGVCLNCNTGQVGQAQDVDGGGEGGKGQFKHLFTLPQTGHIAVLTLTEGQRTNIAKNTTGKQQKYCDCQDRGKFGQHYHFPPFAILNYQYGVHAFTHLYQVAALTPISHVYPKQTDWSGLIISFSTANSLACTE